MRIGIALGELALGAAEGMAMGLDQLVADAQAAERDGFASAWLANINGLDALTGCAVLGRETKTIELGTAVVPTYPRHPFAMAQQAMSTQAACGNRFTLGVGLSHKIVIENMLGLSWDKPYSHMKEYLAALTPLIREGKVSHKGDSYTMNTMVAVKDAKPCPVLVAAMAPKMLALAGSVADGTITWMTGPKTLKDHIVPRLSEGAATVDRGERGAPRVVVSLPFAVGDPAEGMAEAAKRYAVYGSLPSYRAMLDREGAKGPADVAMVGDAASLTAKLDELAQAGVTDFVPASFPVGDDHAASLARTRAMLVDYINR